MCDDALLNFQMLEALRKGDEHQVETLLAHWGKLQRANATTPLHLAATCASSKMNRGRADIVMMLLNTRNIDPTLTNAAGKAAEEIAKTPELQAAFQANRQAFIAERTQFLNHHLAQPTPANVQAIARFFAEDPRANLLDINYRHPTHGLTCLHQAAVLGDEELVSQLLRLGANVFSRDKRGLAPIDVAKAEGVLILLKQLTPSSVVAVDPDRLPRLEGQLKKWTNYAGGYKVRWLVLEGGFLSYYRSQEDTANACRGSLNLAHAKLWIDASDPQKFEVTGKDQTKFHLRAAMLDEAKMWIVAITQTKQYLQRYQASPEMSVANGRSRTNSVDSLELLPSQESLVMALNSTLTQFDLQERLLDKLASGQPSADTALVSTLKRCLASTRSLHQDACKMLEQREAYWRSRFEREAAQNRMWTESLQHLAAEHHAMREWVQEHQDSPCPTPRREVASPSVEDEGDVFFDFDEEDPSDLLDIGSAGHQGGPGPEATSEELINILGEEVRRVPIRQSFVGYPADGGFRTCLPKFQPGSKPPAISLWSVLKNAIGKDLTRITLPVHFNEPSSMLQRMAEDMEYSKLLDLASRQTGVAERLLWVTAFAMSNYSSTAGRVAKPFNPLLGETFEYARPDRGFRYISEQVSHHPPVSACFCESSNYVFFGEVDVKSNFWGKSYELLPQGVSHVLLFLEGGRVEHYSWKKVTTAVTNLIVGNPTIEHYGDMVVKNHATGDVGRLTFKPNRWLSSERNVLEGEVSVGGEPAWELSGAWDDHLSAKRVGRWSVGTEVADEDPLGTSLPKFLHNPSSCNALKLWKRAPPPAEPLPFKLTPFALTLNHLPPELELHLPPTDCRRRPDQRAMEDGLYDQASQKKCRLEEKQREVRKAKEAQLQKALSETPEKDHAQIRKTFEHRPQWFERAVDPDTGEGYWRFTHKYWKDRLQALELGEASPKPWGQVPIIF
ncbi:hypothetical protein L0F63_005984 [Massospora cicadina]|nr:hypothetical protein L0F63_005984 [Massospora cicadina]